MRNALLKMLVNKRWLLTYARHAIEEINLPSFTEPFSDIKTTQKAKGKEMYDNDAAMAYDSNSN